MNTAYIVGGTRTAIGSFGGTLSKVRPDDLAAHVLKSLLAKYPNLDPKNIDELFLGCANQAGEDNRNVARMALLIAGLPYSIPAETINRLCASGLSASIAGARAIMCGDADLVLTGGVENMTRGPWVISKTSTAFGRDAQMFDSSFGWRFINPILQEQYGTDAMGETAENLAEQHSISRADQDAFALWSQEKASKAIQRLAQEITPLTIDKGRGESIIFEKDEFAKANSSLEILAKLKPAFRKNGSVTAGNASGLNDGAAALLLASDKGLDKHQLQPLAKIIASGASGVEPRIMGIGPVEAANKALKKANLTWKDIDLIEINEAFAAQALACTRAWGLEDRDARINPNGGAIALGHPLGMTGARILLSASMELQAQNKKYAMVTMCIGVGQGYAVIIEKV